MDVKNIYIYIFNFLKYTTNIYLDRSPRSKQQVILIGMF